MYKRKENKTMERNIILNILAKYVIYLQYSVEIGRRIWYLIPCEKLEKFVAKFYFTLIGICDRITIIV